MAACCACALVLPPAAALLACLRVVGELPPPDQKLLGQALRYRTLPAGHYLCQPGQVCQELFFIWDGVLRVVVPLGADHETTYFFAQQNQFCTLPDSFTHQRAAHESLQASCPTRVLTLSHRALHRLARCLPYLPSLLEGLHQRHLLRNIEQRNQYLTQPPTMRYEQFRRHHPGLARCVPAPAIASYLGLGSLCT